MHHTFICSYIIFTFIIMHVILFSFFFFLMSVCSQTAYVSMPWMFAYSILPKHFSVIIPPTYMPRGIERSSEVRSSVLPNFRLSVRDLKFALKFLRSYIIQIRW